MLDVKSSTSLITQHIGRVQEAINEGREINQAEFVTNDYKPEKDIKEAKAAKMAKSSSEVLAESASQSQKQINEEHVSHGRIR